MWSAALGLLSLGSAGALCKGTVYASEDGCISRMISDICSQLTVLETERWNQSAFRFFSADLNHYCKSAEIFVLPILN